MLATKAFRYQVKASETAGQFSGRASVYGVVDSYNDAVMPGAFTRSLEELGGKIVVLNQHRPEDPIGTADLLDSDTALLAAGKLVMELQSAKDMYTRLQNDLIDGISIGYEVTKENFVANVRQLQEIKLWEISLVTFPANAFARVTDVKTRFAQLKDVDPKLAEALDLAGSVLSSRELMEALQQADPAVKRRQTKLAADAFARALDQLNEILAVTDPDAEQKKLTSKVIENLRAITSQLKAARN